MNRSAFALLAAPAAALFALFFALPLGVLVVESLDDGGTAFARVFALPTFWPSLGGSLVLTLVAVALSTSVGLAVALHLASMPERRRTLLSFVIALPLTFSGLIVAYGLGNYRSAAVPGAPPAFSTLKPDHRLKPVATADGP